MRSTPVILVALIVGALPLERASAAQACAWIAESVEDDGAHMFNLNLSVDAPTSVAVRFAGPGFTSGSMGGGLIQLDPGAPKEVDGEGFDVSPGDDLEFDVRLFDHALASLDEMKAPSRKPLATFTFQRKVAEDEHTPPARFAKQCKPLGEGGPASPTP
jgi:hypothetical protein